MSAVLQKRRSKRNFDEYALLKDSCNASPAKNFSSRIFPSAQVLPGEPKAATVERREASVPRHGTQGASLGAWRAALRARPRVFRRAPERLSALRPPLNG